MTKLSLIESEARRHLGRISQEALEDLQRSVMALCEHHWSAIRGPEPAPGLAHAMWAVEPHFADLIVDLYGHPDPGFSEAVSHLPPTKVLAALALAEIERGDAEGARLAYEAMMLFETPQAREIHTRHISSRLRGIRLEQRKWQKHVHRDPLFRALDMIAEQTGRWDFRSLTVAVDYLAAIQARPAAEEGEGDEELARILDFLQVMDLVFQGFEEGRIHYTLRGVSKKPVTGKHLEEMLAQLRGNL